MAKYRVESGLISIPHNRIAYRGDLLTAEELHPIDVDRLLALGAIVEVGDETEAQSESLSTEPTLEEMSKGALIKFGNDLGLLLDPKSRKDDLVAAIREAQGVEPAATPESEPEG